MSVSHRKILRLLHHAAASAEDFVDRARWQLRRKTGRDQVRQIVAFRGYADAEKVRLSGRVLANHPSGGPLDDDGWWDNLVNTWRRWESDEAPGAELVVRFGDQEQTAVSDEEGYYQIDLPLDREPGAALQWLTASVSCLTKEGEVRSSHEIVMPSSAASFGIISDLDDTVIHTGITSILLAAKLTFLENAKTRKPLEGVAKLYQVLQRGQADQAVNPIFYISSSPWNLYELLIDFLRLNDVPSGPLLLRDVGLDHTKFVKEKGHGHKQEKALRLLDAYPHLPFVLIGDSGQEDPAIYAEVARLRPGRILASYIRDIDPLVSSSRDELAGKAIELSAQCGVPMILASDSLAISEHARSLGLIPASAFPEVAAETAADKERPETGEQAVRDAVESLVSEGEKED
jgi:phosphatidate phosphatase APP1